MTPSTIPDAELYQPQFSPWLAQSGDFRRLYDRAAERTLVSPDRCHVIYQVLRQCLNFGDAYDVIECGVYKGGTASIIASVMAGHGQSRKLLLFDTFEGMPKANNQVDIHAEGDFRDVSCDEVIDFVGHRDFVYTHKGFMRDCFKYVDSSTRFCFAHVDVDLKGSVRDCLRFIWPRLSVRGCIICDDYGFNSCPGARQAVDEFFSGMLAVPICLPTGQALIFKAFDE